MFKDKEYLRLLFKLAIPIIIQDAIFAGLNMVDIFMIGQLGEKAIATVSLGNQFFFLLAFFLFGVGGGSGIFIAQLWGKRDNDGIHKVIGMGLSIGLSVSTIFMFGVLSFPHFAMGIYTNDTAVIQAGESYLRIVALSYVMTAVTSSYASALRNVQNTRLPMLVGIFSLSLKTSLNFLLITGQFGFPALGINGAALATTIARTMECFILVYLTYRLKTPAAARINELFQYNRQLFKKYLSVALPVVLNEVLWSLGFSTYYAIYARISTEAVAAVNISGSIENLAFVVFIGICESSGIIVGNRIGAGEKELAFTYARRIILLVFSGALVFGLVIIGLKNSLISIYNVTEASRSNINIMLIIFAFTFWIKVTNFNLIVGVFRSGGDTRFAMALDAGSVWVVGVPMAYLGAFVFKFPVYLVYLMLVSEEFVKMVVGLVRFFSKKWINDVTMKMASLDLDALPANLE